MRWNRKKRSVDLKFARGKFLLNHYRNIQRKHFDHHVVEDFVKLASREKRSLTAYRDRASLSSTVIKTIKSPGSEFNRKLRMRRSAKRESRDYSEIDRAYSKYYEKIKARYRNYVKNLFPNPRTRIPLHNNTYPQQPLDDVKNTKKIQVQDGRWYNSYNNPEFRYRATHKARTFSNDLQNEEFEGELGPPVALPSINDPTRSNRFEIKHNQTISNYYPSYNQHNDRLHLEETYEPARKINNSAAIAANIYAQLQSQIVRRKRDADDDGKSTK